MIKQLTDEELLELAFSLNPKVFEFYFSHLPTQFSVLGVLEIDISRMYLTRHPIIVAGKTYAVLGGTERHTYAFFYGCQAIDIERCRMEYLAKYDGRAVASTRGRHFVNLYWEWDDGQ